MSPLIVLCCIALAAAKPSGFHAVSYGAPGPVSVSSQYHAQDALGQYSYGYSAGNSAKAETKSFDGVTRGGYSYVDSHGVVQTANYVADDAHGFQVAATNLPRHVVAGVHDTPAVASAKAAHAVAYNQAAYAAAAAPDVSQSVVVSAPAFSTYAASAPVFSNYAASAPAYSTYAASAPVFSNYAASAPVFSNYAASAPVFSTYAASAPASTYVASAPAVSVVKQVPSKAFSYSTVAASPVVHNSVAVSPAVKTVFSSAPAVTSYAVHDAVVPSKAFSYSTVAASPSVAVAAAPAAVSYSVAAEHVPVVSYSALQHQVPVVTHHAPAVSYSAPAAVGVVGGTTSQQYHAQDSLGQYAYGYSGGPSAKVETKTLDGVTRGGYSYVDGNGLVQSARYVADDSHGFRVAATNIPVGPDAGVFHHNLAVAPVGVVGGDTAEVVAAKAAHFAAYAAAVKSHDYYDY